MRRVPVFLPTALVLVLLGAWAGTSMGQLPPPPTVSVPTVPVSVPSLPLPPPPPPPAAPTVTAPSVSVPSPPTPKPPVPLPVTVPTPVPETPATLPSSEPDPLAPTGGGTGGPAARQFGASSRIFTITRIRASRPWVTVHGSLSGNGIWISFSLSRAGTVVFLVDELAPKCRYVGRFLVRGRAGRNAVRFRGRLNGRTLDPATYRLTAHPRGHRARRLAGVTVVMLEHPVGPARIAAEQARNTCPDGVPASARPTAPTPDAGKDGGVAGVSATAKSARPYDDSTGPLGAALGAIEAAADAVPPALLALALLAVLLLAVAAMPQPVRASLAGAALVHHRGTVALAGVGVLVAAVLSFALLT